LVQGEIPTLTEGETQVEGDSQSKQESTTKRKWEPFTTNPTPEAISQEWCFVEETTNAAPDSTTPPHKAIRDSTIETYALALVGSDPTEPPTYKAACGGPDAARWKDAMDDEFRSLMENKTWDLVDETDASNLLSGKWTYRLKRGSEGQITRYKARRVVRGFEQEYGIDYNETFASVVRQKTYRSLFALAAIHDWEIEQMDIKTAFLYGPVEETIFVQLPPGYEAPGKVCRLNKALYGLKQAPRVWFLTLSKALSEIGFRKSEYDEAVFYMDDMTLAVYVDDILIFGPQRSRFRW